MDGSFFSLLSSSTYDPIDTVWVLLGAVLVFFMQAGFAMVETGMTRAKNSGNIIMKNLMDFCIGTIVFWILGFSLMFGEDIGGVIGNPFPFFAQWQTAWTDGFTFPHMAFIIFQTVFCATSATIVSGAMAERTKFISYCIYSLIISAVVYPISGHWIWGGGWLSQLGFHDFAGSTAVHMVGGVAALIGAKILGPRIGKYGKDGTIHAIPGHNLTLAALGVFILWFCWFGFNGGSTTAATGAEEAMGHILVTTNLAAAVSTTTVMIATWIRYKKPDISMTLNGSLAGLVAITAGCDTVDPFGAAIIGLLAGLLVMFGIEFIDKKLKIDDPVGAIGVHGLCGAFGTLMVGFFGATDSYRGLFYGGGFRLLGIQALGVISVIAWVTVTMMLTFLLLKKTVGLRVTEHEEIVGLDIEEHGLSSSYADFMPMPMIAETGVTVDYTVPTTHEGTVAPDQAIPVEYAPPAADKNKFTKVVIVTKQTKFEALKYAMNGIGVMGMTVTNVLGCGMQKGRTEKYRGVDMDLNLLPKVKVEIVVSKIPVAKVVETAKQALYTGQIGDGKIFVYDVEDVVKIRTGEHGYDALQDE